MILPRRKFLTGLAASFLAAPAIVRASSLMAISPVPELVKPYPIVNVTMWSKVIADHYDWERLHTQAFLAAEPIFAGQLVSIDSNGYAHRAETYHPSRGNTIAGVASTNSMVPS